MRPPLRVPRLHGRQAARLNSLYRDTQCPRTRLRAQMVLLSSEGRSVVEIAAITRQSDDTVRRWLHRFIDQGWRGLLEAPRSGRPALITPAVEQFLAECLQKTPRDYRISRPSWTTALLAAVVQRRLKIKVSDECVRQHLERVEGVCRRPTWTVQYRARQKPGYAQKKAGSQGFCGTRHAGSMSMFRMKPSSVSFRPSRACGCCAASSAESAHPVSGRPSGTNAQRPIGAQARSCGYAPRNATLKHSAGWSRSAWRARPGASGG